MLARAVRDEERVVAGVHNPVQRRQDRLLPHGRPTFAVFVIEFAQKYYLDILVFQKAKSVDEGSVEKASLSAPKVGSR